ncbi:flagellar motor switch protein FliM [Chryseomicrobium palamuruense]|uniref:Flagellar motor switch protein FliM n=1 Tax=Chryseomicrobium palamuruense TaxID=682973 RepID=A0ABV8UXU4_9BACL
MVPRSDAASYDFRRASKLSQLHVRSFLRVNEKVSRLIGNQLTGKLDKFTTAAPSSIRQMTYEELSLSTDPLTVVVICSFPPLRGDFQLIISNKLIHSCIERLLGGDLGETDEKELTEIDKVLLKQLADEWLALYAESLSAILPVDTKLHRIELAQDYNFPLHVREKVVVLDTEVQLMSTSGLFELVVPNSAMESIVPRLTASEKIARKEDEESVQVRKMVESGIQQTELEVRAVLGHCDLDVRDFLTLQQGDVLRLSTAYDEPIEVYVDQKKMYSAQMGTHRGKRAIQILEQEE